MVGSSFAVRKSIDLPEAEKGDVSFLKTFVFDYQYEDFGGGHRARRRDSHKPFLQLDEDVDIILRVLIIMAEPMLVDSSRPCSRFSGR